ncbi:MAG: serine/threonine-protein kinase [Thermodesulfobacteriota bacterium]|nr:serine/threonine-protein kinase [Thermodesulfobacteriota bacterium]
MTNKRIWFTGISVLLILLILHLLHLEHTEYIEKKFLDTYFRIRGSVQSSAPIIIIAIDDKSIFTYGPWPWPRQRMARLIERLSEAKSRVIAFDIIFPAIKEKTRRQGEGDRLLYKTAKDAGNVIFPVFFQLDSEKRERQSLIPPSVGSSSFLLFDDILQMKQLNLPKGYTLFPTDELIAAGGNGVGHVNTILDRDGPIRFEPLIIEYKDRYFPPLSIQTVRRYLDLSWGVVKVEGGKGIRMGEIEIPMDDRGFLLINYYGPYGSFPYLSYKDVMEDPHLQRKCEDKIVLVGVTAAGLHDQWKTPLDIHLPGVEKHANIISSILERRFLSRPLHMDWIEISLLVIFGVLFTGLFPHMTTRNYLLCGSLVFLMTIISSYLLFAYLHLWFKPLFLLLLMVFLQSVLLITRIATKPTLSREVPEPEIVLDTKFQKATVPAFSEVESMTGVHRIGRYIIHEEIGRGAMGIVYKALDPNINRTVVIKTIRFDQLCETDQRENLKKRFFAEAEAAGRLSHPHIVTIYDAGKESGHSYIVMEYIEGIDLTSYCRKENLMDIREVIRLIADVCDALDYAHTNRIIHRDIKPANIMIQKDRRVKVMDFGIAKLPSSHLTQTGTVIGTPSYMSPEQIHGEDLDGRSDMFSIGIVLYELLTGEKPFKGENVSTVTFQITEGEYTPPQEINPEIPAEYVNIMNKVLRKRREERYQTAGELAEDLRRVLMTSK